MLEKLEKRTKVFWMVSGYLLIALLGAIDSQFKPVVFLAPLYLLPISILSWFAGKWHGIAASVLCTITWLSADIYAGGYLAQPQTYYWNTFSALATFLFFTALITNYHSKRELAFALSQKDSLTGVSNSRSFLNAAQQEIERCRKLNRSFTLCCVDVDNLKTINEQLGFTQGDKVLRAIAENIQSHLRRSDVIARISGDEFAIILPDAGQEAAREVVNRIRRHLDDEMKGNNRALTFSIGVLVCLEHPKTVDEAMKTVRELVEFVKNNGKDGVCYSIYNRSPEDLNMN